MAQDNQVNLPGGFGGLMRYGEEYDSKFMLTPTTVIILIIALVIGRIALPLFF